MNPDTTSISQENQEPVSPTKRIPSKSRSQRRSMKSNKLSKIQLQFLTSQDQDDFNAMLQSNNVLFDVAQCEFGSAIYEFQKRIPRKTLKGWIKEFKGNITLVENEDALNAVIAESKAKIIDKNGDLFESFGLFLDAHPELEGQPEISEQSETEEKIPQESKKDKEESKENPIFDPNQKVIKNRSHWKVPEKTKAKRATPVEKITESYGPEDMNTIVDLYNQPGEEAVLNKILENSVEAAEAEAAQEEANK